MMFLVHYLAAMVFLVYYLDLLIAWGQLYPFPRVHLFLKNEDGGWQLVGKG